MITDIRIHQVRNGTTITLDTETETYEYVFKDLATTLRKTKHLINEIIELEAESE